MSDELPEGWTSARISTVFDCWGGMTPSKANPSYWGGAVPWVSSKDVKARTINGGTEFITVKALSETRLRVCRPGTVLVVVRSGVLAHTLPVSLTSREVVVNQDVKALDSGDDDLNAWLAAYLRTFQRLILEENRKDGTTVQSIRVEQLLDRDLPVPPLAEQPRIVAKVEALLDDVNKARDRLAKVPLILKRFRQSVLAAACSGRLTEEWRLAHPNLASGADVLVAVEAVRVKRDLPAAKRAIDDQDIELPATELPESWAWCRVGQVADVRLGGTPSRSEASYWGGNIPWVSSGEVANCRISGTAERITKKGLENSNAKLYPAGTVLIAMIGEGKTRGQSAILDIEACTNQNAAGLVFDAGIVNPEYVWLWALGEYEKNRDVGRGGNQPALNGAKVRALPLPLPPVEEQAAIVQRVRGLLSVIDELEARVVTATKVTERLPQAILAKAFSGQLVPTEAELARAEGRDFEPASALLARLAAQSASAPRARRGRGKRKTQRAAS